MVKHFTLKKDESKIFKRHIPRNIRQIISLCINLAAAEKGNRRIIDLRNIKIRLEKSYLATLERKVNSLFFNVFAQLGVFF